MRRVAVSGYCERNPNGPSGWCYLFSDGSWRAGGLVRGNTSVAELLAVLMLLKDFPNEDLRIYSSSSYVVGVCSLWKKSWQRKGYLKEDGTKRGNHQLIIPIHHLLDTSPGTIEFIKTPDRDVNNKFPMGSAARRHAVEAANGAKEKGVEILLGTI